MSNVLGGAAHATHEHGAWLNGEPASRAEVNRARMKHSAEKDLVEEVLKPRATDAGHWSWQPVGGRSAHVLPKHGANAVVKGALRAMENRSNVDLVVFGHEQDAAEGDEPAANFEYTTADWVGQKQKVGVLDSNNSRVDSIVFGVDLDGYNATPAEIEAEIRGMPEFAGAAGLVSVQTKENRHQSKVYLQEHQKPTFYARLRQGGDVDEVQGLGRTLTP